MSHANPGYVYTKKTEIHSQFSKHLENQKRSVSNF